MTRVGGLWDGKAGSTPDEECERDLARGRAAGIGDLGEDSGRQKLPRAEGAVGYDRDAVLLTVRNDGVLDGPLLEVVEDLVADHLALSGDLERVREPLLVEVAHAPGADLARVPQLFERGERVRQRVRSFPVQEVAVQPVGPQMPQAPLAGLDRAFA